MRNHDEVREELFKRRDLYYKKRAATRKKIIMTSLPLSICVIIVAAVGADSLKLHNSDVVKIGITEATETTNSDLTDDSFYYDNTDLREDYDGNNIEDSNSSPSAALNNNFLGIPFVTDAFQGLIGAPSDSQNSTGPASSKIPQQIFTIFTEETEAPINTQATEFTQETDAAEKPTQAPVVTENPTPAPVATEKPTVKPTIGEIAWTTEAPTPTTCPENYPGIPATNPTFPQQNSNTKPSEPSVPTATEGFASIKSEIEAVKYDSIKVSYTSNGKNVVRKLKVKGNEEIAKGLITCLIYPDYTGKTADNAKLSKTVSMKFEIVTSNGKSRSFIYYKDYAFKQSGSSKVRVLESNCIETINYYINKMPIV